MNRGIARRTLFENRGDIRFFLSRLACVVHSGVLEVHAFSVMTTHFHMLVRSLCGELSAALQAIQNEYVRRFNRERRRDGPLVRGRFLSRPVRSQRYRRVLVSYIDDNPVAAGLVPVPRLYPHGSARYHASSQGPPWLARRWVEDFLRQVQRRTGGALPAYEEVFGAPLTPALRRLIERRLVAPPNITDPLDELFEASAPAVKEWMRLKAELADGTQPGIPIVDPESVLKAVQEAAAFEKPWEVKPTRKAIDGWTIARLALLRDLGGVTFEEAAQRIGSSPDAASNLYRHHRRLIGSDEEYAERLRRLAESAMAACHGSNPGEVVRAPYLAVRGLGAGETAADCSGTVPGVSTRTATAR